MVCVLSSKEYKRHQYLYRNKSVYVCMRDLRKILYKFMVYVVLFYNPVLSFFSTSQKNVGLRYQIDFFQIFAVMWYVKMNVGTLYIIYLIKCDYRKYY